MCLVAEIIIHNLSYIKGVYTAFILAIVGEIMKHNSCKPVSLSKVHSNRVAPNHFTVCFLAEIIMYNSYSTFRSRCMHLVSLRVVA